LRIKFDSQKIIYIPYEVFFKMKFTKYTAFILIGIFAVLFVVIHFLRTDLYFLKYPLSRYTIGEYGAIMSIGFICFGFSEILLGYNIIVLFGKVNLVSILAILAGFGVFLATFFSMDIQNKPTIAGNLHFTGALIQFIVFPFFCFVSSRYLFKDGLKYPALLVGIITFFFCFLLTLAISIKNDILFSIAEKIDILVFTIWLMVVEIQMIRNKI
jgi:Protein of unknown function (DUF998)